MISLLSNGMPLISTEVESPIRPTIFPVCQNMFFGVCAKSSPTSPKPPSYPIEKPPVDQQAFETASDHPELYESERSSFQPLHPASRNRRRVGCVTALVALLLLALAIGTVASVVATEVRKRALSHSRYVISSQPKFCHDTYHHRSASGLPESQENVSQIIPNASLSLPSPCPNTVGMGGVLAMNGSACPVKSATEVAAMNLPDDQLRKVVQDCPPICLAASGGG